MSRHGKLRENKRCENCGHFVEKRFCPECGQENVETSRSFHYLFMHFVEDYIHYDGRFWQTLKYLLFRPAKLTKEYLSGKRNRYVPPVTLYIFVSFVTFFLPPVLPEKDSSPEKEFNKGFIEGVRNEKTPAPQVVVSDNQQKPEDKDISAKPEKQEATINIEIGSKKKSNDKGVDEVEINGKKISINKEKLLERTEHDFPKAVFLYMPVFAFWLWLFHNKKKWYYFDHGIFTLHFFSFLLLSILVLMLFNRLLSLFHFENDYVDGSVKFLIIGYMIYYFFHSHRLVYKESKAISRLKCSLLFFINFFCILAFQATFLLFEMFITNPVFFHEIINKIRSS